jgi:hypothetical protein
MPIKTWILSLVCFSLALAGCGSPTAKPLAGSGACSLLSDSEIREVQGEAIAEKTSSETSSGKLETSQCFYRLPTFSKSINLEVTRAKEPADSVRAIDEFWKRKFGADPERESGTEKIEPEETSRNTAKPESEDREKEEENRARPQSISGIGDEAFWTGNQISGSLYFRKGDTIVRVSIGGPDDQPVKINKARALAEKLLENL